MNFRYTLLFLFVSLIGFAQNQEWGSYFSYTNVVAMAQTNNRMYAASGSAIFSQSASSGELKTITSVDGLKADDITAVHYSTGTQRLLVGNSTGLLLVVNADGTVVTKIDIVQETNVTYNKKKINSIFEYNGIAYLSCDFGIVLFNIATLQFGDTYLIGAGGAEVAVFQCAVYNGYLYAGTQEGLVRAPIDSPLIRDAATWVQQLGGPWKCVLAIGGKLYTSAEWNLFLVYDGSSFLTFTTFPSAPLDMREVNGNMVVTCASKVVVYDSTGTQRFEINTVGEAATFTCATLVGNSAYVGTAEKGVFSVNTSTFQSSNITPNGPLMSNIFSLKKSRGALWAVYGVADVNFDPKGMEYGVSKYVSGTGWTNIPFSTLSTIGGVTKPMRDILDAVINPNDEKQVYLISGSTGMLKLTDMVPTAVYDETNSGIQNQQSTSASFRSVRVQAGTFDSSGNLWLMNGLTEKPLKKFNSTWTSYSFEDVYPTPKSMQYNEIVIDDSGTKWIATGPSTGLVGYNESLNKFMRLSDNNNLPSKYVKSLALDNSGRLWIGTTNGLRVIYSTQRFASEDILDASSVIFEEDGVAQELMYAQTINDIEVDGSNNKWFGTDTAGAFLVSPDGQTTLQHFTKANSPLPSNTINSIAIDNVTGEVFFATDKGMVSYKGSSTEASDDLSKVYVYPNPVRPNYSGDVKITNLTDRAVVKITDIEGNLVYEATSEGGTVTWDTTAFGKYKVRTGVYMVFISSDDTTMVATRKLMIVRGN